tara:strand:- start:61519 stop:61749 length:231 start_codon:yes stop_codon:yes gene_type:complete
VAGPAARQVEQLLFILILLPKKFIRRNAQARGAVFSARRARKNMHERKVALPQQDGANYCVCAGSLGDPRCFFIKR